MSLPDAHGWVLLSAPEERGGIKSRDKILDLSI